MKIAIIGPSEKYASGISNYTWRLSSEIGALPVLYRNMLPLFLFPGKGRVGEAKTKISYPDTPAYLDYYNPITWIRAIKVIKRSDIFIVEWWSSSVAHMLLFICLLSGRRFVIEAHEVLDPLEQKSFLLNVYGRLCRYILFNKASHIVVHNQQDLSLICDRYKNVSVIPHAVYDQFNRVERTCPKCQFNVLFFGLLREYKGINYLIEAFNKSNIENKHLYIVGENWDHIKIPNQENIHVHSEYVPDWAVEYFFSQADVLVLPYLRGSASGVAAIGMHFGLPIIASDLPEMREQMDGYFGTVYTDTKDKMVQTIRIALEGISKDPAKIKFKVPQRLTWKRITEQWMEVLDRVCHNS